MKREQSFPLTNHELAAEVAALRAAPTPAPTDGLKDVAMAARRGLAFGHQATPQTPERMIERKEQALGQILDICERHGVSSSVLRAPAPVATPTPETPAPDYTPPSTSNTVHSGDGSVRDHTAWIAMCERRKAETPAPDAMPEIHAGDVVKASNYARPVEMEHQHTVDWFNERPFLVESVQRVIWRRQEAQP